MHALHLHDSDSHQELRVYCSNIQCYTIDDGKSTILTLHRIRRACSEYEVIMKILDSESYNSYCVCEMRCDGM